MAPPLKLLYQRWPQTDVENFNYILVCGKRYHFGILPCIYCPPCPMRLKEPRVGDKCGRQVWETSVGDKCKLMRPKEPRVGDKCGKQVWETRVGDKRGTQVWETSGRQVSTHAAQGTRSPRDKWETSVNSCGPRHP